MLSFCMRIGFKISSNVQKMLVFLSKAKKMKYELCFIFVKIYVHIGVHSATQSCTPVVLCESSLPKEWRRQLKKPDLMTLQFYCKRI